MEDKIYEVGNYVGYGSFGAYFTLKDYPKLGVKIFFKNNLSEIKKELKKGIILRNLNISVPKYAGIIKIKLSLEEATDINERIFKNENLGPSYFDSNIIYQGLIIEYIDNDLENNILSEIKIPYMESTFIYDKTIEDFLNIELEKIKKLNIKPIDSDSLRHVLWNSRKKKYYFIDVGMWKIPLKYYIKYYFK